MTELRSNSGPQTPDPVPLPPKANKTAYVWSAVYRRTKNTTGGLLEAKKETALDSQLIENPESG